MEKNKEQVSLEKLEAHIMDFCSKLWNRGYDGVFRVVMGRKAAPSVPGQDEGTFGAALRKLMASDSRPKVYEGSLPIVISKVIKSAREQEALDELFPFWLNTSWSAGQGRSVLCGFKLDFNADKGIGISMIGLDYLKANGDVIDVRQLSPALSASLPSKREIASLLKPLAKRKKANGKSLNAKGRFRP